MLVKDFLQETDKKFYIRPHVVCADGFRLSIQAGPGLYCHAKDGYVGTGDHINCLAGDIPYSGEWDSVEVGLDSAQEQYSEKDQQRLGSKGCDEVDNLLVFLFVPLGDVEKECLAHGGIVKIDYDGRSVPVGVYDV